MVELDSGKTTINRKFSIPDFNIAFMDSSLNEVELKLPLKQSHLQE